MLRDLQIVAMDSGGSLVPILQIAGQYESEKTLDLHLILQMKNYIFVLNLGNLEAPLMVLPMK